MYTYFYGKLLSKLLSSGQMPGWAVKFPTGPSNSRLYGGNVKSNALELPGGGGLIAVGFDSYISVKVQFFCLPIGQNRVTCRSIKRHVRQPVRNQTFIDRSIIKWVQYACVSTMKFQSSFLKLFTKHIRRSIYSVLVSN